MFFDPCRFDLRFIRVPLNVLTSLYPAPCKILFCLYHNTLLLQVSNFIIGAEIWLLAIYHFTSLKLSDYTTLQKYVQGDPEVGYSKEIDVCIRMSNLKQQLINE